MMKEVQKVIIVLAIHRGLVIIVRMMVMIIKETVVKLVVVVVVVELLRELPPELLSVPGLMVLEPVEHILALYLAIQRQVGCDLLYLSCVWRPHPTSVHLLQDHQLLWCWAPPC